MPPITMQKQLKTVVQPHVFEINQASSVIFGAAKEMPEPEIRRVLAPATIATARILEKWHSEGGPASSLGLPMDQNPTVYLEGDEYVMDFRGGKARTRRPRFVGDVSGHRLREGMAKSRSAPGIILEKYGNNVQATTTLAEAKPLLANIRKLSDTNSEDVQFTDLRRVRVTFVGYGLNSRQEKGGDELYGVIGSSIGSLGHSRTWGLQTITLGPNRDNRIWGTNVVLYEGPPADIGIIFNMIEHDSGDRNEIRRKFQEKTLQVFETLGSLVGAGAGGALGSIASGFGAESASAGGLIREVANAIGGLLSDIFGMGDDPYNPGTFTISANEMIWIPPQNEFACGEDPRRLRNTHRLTVSGRDDGGDEGIITGCFLVEQI